MQIVFLLSKLYMLILNRASLSLSGDNATESSRTRIAAVSSMVYKSGNVNLSFKRNIYTLKIAFFTSYSFSVWISYTILWVLSRRRCRAKVAHQTPKFEMARNTVRMCEVQISCKYGHSMRHPIAYLISTAPCGWRRRYWFQAELPWLTTAVLLINYARLSQKRGHLYVAIDAARRKMSWWTTCRDLGTNRGFHDSKCSAKEASSRCP